MSEKFTGSISRKQKLYAEYYLKSEDPLYAYVKSGYARSEEEAKKSRNFKKPLNSKVIQAYIQFLKSKEQNRLPCQESEDVSNSKARSKADAQEIELFLTGVLRNYKENTKTRLMASEQLLRIFGLYNGSSNSNTNASVEVVFYDNVTE